ncbi:IS256 family transposase [Nocardia gipuzkoensis]
MTAVQPIDPSKMLSDQLAVASPDLLRDMMSTFIQALMSAEADAVCGAGYGERSEGRVNHRNGYRHRDFDTRVGTIDLAVPKLRSGSYFPDWLLERRKRAERAPTSVVATCYLLGVSTRRMEKLVESLGVTKLSKSQVSIMSAELDAQVEAFRTRPLDQGPYTFVAADALVLKVREDGRVVNVHTLVATGVNADGYREILGIQVTSGEDGAGWLAFFRDLVARGLSGVALVTSDAHSGLVAAIGATLPGASWQRCRTHYTVNLMSICPKTSWPWVRTLLHSVFDQADPESVAAQYDRMLDALTEKLPRVAAHLDGARADLLAFTAFPKQIWRQIWSNNPQERLNKEIRRRTDVVGIFPDRNSIIRLVGAVLAEQHDEWIEGRRYLGLDVLARSRGLADPATEQEDATAALTA